MVHPSETLRNLQQIYGRRPVENQKLHPVKQQMLDQQHQQDQAIVAAYSTMRHIIEHPESILAPEKKKSKKKSKAKAKSPGRGKP